MRYKTIKLLSPTNKLILEYFTTCMVVRNTFKKEIYFIEYLVYNAQLCSENYIYRKISIHILPINR